MAYSWWKNWQPPGLFAKVIKGNKGSQSETGISPMKTNLLKILIASTAFVLTWCANAIPLPSITVSPTIISNYYPGVITLNMSGLTNTEQVIVNKWLDANTNGVIDPGERVVDVFRINDGGAMIISGVTNLNVPFDSNPTNGAITTTLNCPQGMVIETMVGRYIYQMASPTGRFSPVTATLTVTNAPLAQSVSGTIYSNGIPQPYAVVVFQDQHISNPAGAAVSDSNGHYFITLPVSAYTPIASALNCYFDFNTAPNIVLTNGMSVTNDLFLTNGTATISGTVSNAANGSGIGGLLLIAQSGSAFEIIFTDTNGNYSAAVTPNFWKIDPSKERLARRAFVYPEIALQVDTTSNNVTGANIALPKGNALFYGRITDNLNHPFANVEVDADGNGTNSSDTSFSAKGYSGQDGYYAVAVLGDLTNNWGCNMNNTKDPAVANYVFNTFPLVTNAPNQTRLENFIALPTIGTISGHVQGNDGTNVTGVALYANALINGTNYQTLDGSTDNSGNYSLAVAAGTWGVQFLTGGSDDNLDTHGYFDPYAPHTVVVPPTNSVLNITVYSFGTPFISSAQRFSSTHFGFDISGSNSVNYTVQYSTNLASPTWSTLASFQLTTNPFPVVDVNATNPARFYRVLKN